MAYSQKIHKTYSGKGEIIFDDGLTLSVTFEATQDVTGGILIECYHVSSERVGLSEEDNLFFKRVRSFEGTTNEGCLFQAEAVQIKTYSLPRMREGRWHFRLRLRAGKLTLVGPFQPDPKEFVIFRFDLVNLTLEPDEIVSSQDGGLYLGQFTVNLDGHPFIFRSVQQYDEIIKDLKYTHGVDVTYSLSVIAAKQDSDKIVQAVDDICMLLTFARGTKVTWISYEIRTFCNNIIRSVHLNAKTKSFGVLSIISPRFAPKEVNDTRQFLTQCYGAYQKAKDKWALEKAIHGYIDGLMEEDFIEARALKLVIVVEHLKGIYLKKKKMTTILTSRQFRKVQKKLKPVIQNELERQLQIVSDFKDEDLELIVKSMTEHIPAMNRYSLRYTLSVMIKDLGATPLRDDISRFVKIRNTLVHQAGFSKNEGSCTEQYFFIMMFVGRLLLAILQYQGYYNDWADRSIERPFWPETIRKRLILEKHKE